MSTPDTPATTLRDDEREALEAHAGCHDAWARERARRQFAEARLHALEVAVRALGHRMDGVNGHAAHDLLGGKTLGGAVRGLLTEGADR